MSSSIDWRHQYDAERDTAISNETGISCPPGEDMAVQSGKDDADINVILRRFGITGEMPAPPASVPYYGDFTMVDDYQTAVAAVQDAWEAFMELPAEMRSRFDNDPGELLTFLEDPANRKEAIELGLLEAPPPAPATPPSGGTGGQQPPAA